MDQKIIYLTQEKELRIFMHPLRQRILREMSLCGGPLTAKHLADRMGITPSAAKHHLTKLMEIGLVDIHHTEQIRSITATYYQRLSVEVHIGRDSRDNIEFAEEADMVAENLLMNVYGGLCESIKESRLRDKKEAGEHFTGELLTGMIFLTQQEADELQRRLLRYIEEHRQKKGDTLPYEYALILYRPKE